MIVDSSAVVALVMREPEWRTIEEKIGDAKELGIAAPTLLETGIVLSARCGKDMRTVLARLVGEIGMEIVPFGRDHYSVAVGAWLDFGKGRHAAALNFGDCISYATANVAQQPLLCTGGDFGLTDIDLA